MWLNIRSSIIACIVGILISGFGLFTLRGMLNTGELQIYTTNNYYENPSNVTNASNITWASESNDPNNHFNKIYDTTNLNTLEHMVIQNYEENPQNQRFLNSTEISKMLDEYENNENNDTLHKKLNKMSQACNNFETIQIQVKPIADRLLYYNIRAEDIDPKDIEQIVDDLYEIGLTLHNDFYGVNDCRLYSICDSMKTSLFEFMQIYFRSEKLVKNLESVKNSKKTKNVRKHAKHIFDRTDDFITEFFKAVFRCNMYSAQNQLNAANAQNSSLNKYCDTYKNKSEQKNSLYYNILNDYRLNLKSINYKLYIVLGNPTKSDEIHQEVIATFKSLKKDILNEKIINEKPFENIACNDWNAYEDSLSLLFELYTMNKGHGARWHYIQNYVFRNWETTVKLNDANKELTEATTVVIEGIMAKKYGCEGRDYVETDKTILP